MLARVRHLHRCCPTASTPWPAQAPLRVARRSHSSSTTSKGHNNAIIEHLKQHLQEENERQDRNAYKIRAFGSAIKVIDRLDHPIRSMAEAKALSGVGDGILRRIEVFLSDPDVSSSGEASPGLPPLDPARKQVVSALQLVRGIGPRTARQLVDAGCMSVSDLHKYRYNSMLTPTMRKGLRFRNHLDEPVSREQAELTLKFIREHISAKFDIILTGSYRRGNTSSSDINVVLLHPSYVHIPTPDPVSRNIDSRPPGKRNGNASSQFLVDVVRLLTDYGLLAVMFSSGPRRWQGIVRLPERTPGGQWEEKSRRLTQIQRTEGVYRRMNIYLVPVKSRGAALLALTGDVEFIKHVRSKAIALGLHLNEFGLWRWRTEDDGRVSPVESDGAIVREDRGFWELVRADSEEDILSELGMEYVEPEKRNFELLSGKNSRRRSKKSSGTC